jgi:hypothetical protein
MDLRETECEFIIWLWIRQNGMLLRAMPWSLLISCTRSIYEKGLQWFENRYWDSGGQHIWIWKTGFGSHLSIRLYVWWMSLASAWTVGRILFTFGIYEFIRHRSVSGEYDHSAFRSRRPSNGPQKSISLKTVPRYRLHISILRRPIT